MKKPNILVFYIRISVEDRDNHVDEKEESDSIVNQRALLWGYIGKKPELAGYEVMEICDDGYSGTNLNRPGMVKLLDMTKKGQVGCIVVKDFSRFGRNYLTVSDYIDQIFPFMGIRFISVNDHYDSATCRGATSGVDMAFRNIIYGYYSHDLSIKVKSGKRVRAENGDFLSSFAPIGYRKSPGNKNKLEVEPEGAAIVQRIFDMAGAGMSVPQITRKLNQEHVLTPSQMKNRMGQLHKWWVGIGDRKVWNSQVVLNILRDERYLGKNIYGRKSRVGVGDSHIKQNDREDWVIVEDCHEAVISKEKFAAAQRNVCGYVKKGKQESVKHLFSGKLRCVACGYLLHCIKRPVLHYRCMTWRKVEGVSCAKGDLKESELAETVLAAIHLYVKTLLDERDARQKAKEGGRIPVLRRQLDMLKANIQGFQERKAILYDRLAEGEIDRREFQNNQDVISHQQEEAQKQYDKLKKEVSQLECLTNGERVQERELGNYLGMKELTREMVEAFVECIYVYGDKTFHIQWKFEEVVGKK